MADDSDFIVEGWDEFVENFARLVDKWEEKKIQLLNQLGLIYQSEVMLTLEEGGHDDSSTLKHSFKIYVFGDHDYVDVATNVEYALYLNDGHIQHRRALPVEYLTVGGKKKGYRTVKSKKSGKSYVLLRERYVPGVHYLEEAKRRSEPRWKRRVDSFMLQIAREVEGGKL